MVEEFVFEKYELRVCLFSMSFTCHVKFTWIVLFCYLGLFGVYGLSVYM